MVSTSPDDHDQTSRGEYLVKIQKMYKENGKLPKLFLILVGRLTLHSSFSLKFSRELESIVYLLCTFPGSIQTRNIETDSLPTFGSRTAIAHALEIKASVMSTKT